MADKYTIQYGNVTYGFEWETGDEDSLLGGIRQMLTAIATDEGKPLQFIETGDLPLI